MRRISIRLAAAFFSVFILQYCTAQRIDSVMSIYDEQFPHEKIHIHFDKAAYNQEETIWYKVYLLSGSELSGISKNIYVEWYDTTGKIIKQTVAPVYQASAKGAFELPAGYSGNFIHVKAFTRWMLNDDPAFSYERDIPVNSGALPIARAAVPSQTRLELFPEGGFIVRGIPSRVAFKASNQFGNPVLVKALLLNDKNKVLDTLKVQHDGMGMFTLASKEGENYKVNWTDASGKTGTVPVDITKTRGASMRVITTNEKAVVRVERTADAGDNFAHLNLLVHMNQKLYFTAALNLADKLAQQASIPIDELPTGILQLSILTSDWVPVAERIVFINNHLHEFNAKINPQLVSLEKRGRNVIDITVSDTAMANMSVAITDAGVPVPEATIFSDILLSDELRGKIYNPAYYLKSDADTITAHLDLVMMTNGWRRFDWDKIKAGELPKLQYPAETGLMKISGKVLGMKAAGPAQSLLLNLIVLGKDSSKTFMFIPVQKDGSFEDRTAFFYDTVRLFYSFNGNSKLTDVTQVQFSNGLLPQQYKTTKYGPRDAWTAWTDSLARVRLNFFLMQQEALKKAMAATTLQEVIVKTRARKDVGLQELDKKYASGLFTGGDGYSFDLAEDPFAKSALDVLSYLQGKVAGLNITGSGTQATASWRGGTPDLFMNEMQTSMDQLQTVNVNDIAYIKVFRPPFFGSIGGGSGGAIAIYTKKGKDARKASPDARGLENTILGGYSRFKEFYSPSYDKTNENPESDVRTTLYWSPYVLTDKKNPRFRIQFYNNDISRKLQVVLEGTNSDGKMTRVVKMLE
jgi:hypothetical protein